MVMPLYESLKAQQIGPIDTRRVIAAAYPAVDVYADLDLPSDLWGALHAVESLTNARLEADAKGPRFAAQGDGASFITAPFAYKRESRFSAGDFGIYYCAEREETAIREVAFHKARFLRDSKRPAQTISLRSVGATLSGSAYDVFQSEWSWLRSSDYRQCQDFGLFARSRVQALRYESVRHRGHVGFAVFDHAALSNARHLAYLEMAWNGKTMTHFSRVGGAIGEL